ncbi:MAG: GspE/PulE family protein, partial [Bdellovibrionota bacterium]
MELYDWSNWSPCEASLSLLPQRLALDFEAFPIALSAGQLHLAVSEDCDLDQQDLLEHLLKQRLVFWRASKEVIQEKITRHYPRENLAASALAFREPKVSFDHSQLDYFENTLHEAIAQGASDIHFEPFEKNIRLRYRIDGRLRLAGELPKSIHGAFINALKVRANLPIDQHKNPLDGRLSVRVKAGDYDLRLAFLPTVYGQSLVVRILEKNAQSIDLSSMLLSAENARRLQNLLALENGLVLVVGPTGSGKTTTLYAALRTILTRG